jgi:2-amino-4-hydroxy-6-hydroxymethyldihydropteridine diphosphokinase
VARVFVALGGNVGDVLAAFRSALVALEAEVGAVVQVSSAYRSVAEVLDERPGPDYWNAVCEMDARLDPAPLLASLKRIERDAGRQENGLWQPRPLDLDLLLYDERVLGGAELRVPHPRLRRRAFVLQPLRELSPQLRLPPDGVSVAACVERQRWPWEGILQRRVGWWRGGADFVGSAIEDDPLLRPSRRASMAAPRGDARAVAVGE